MEGNSNNTSNNETSLTRDGSSVFDKTFLTVTVSLIIIIIFAAVCGNLLVCLAISLNQRLRKVTNYFIVSLAISDLMTACFSMPFDVQALIHPFGWNNGEFTCNFWAFMYLIAAPTSILNLMAVSIDRYRAISAPLQYYDKMRPKRALAFIAIIWLYSFVFTTVGMVGWPFYDHSVINGMCFFNIHPYFSVTSSAVNFIFPTVVMCVIYFKIYLIANAHAHRLANEVPEPVPSCLSNEDSANMTNEKKRTKRNIKAAKTIAILVSTFLVCWMPITLLSTVGSLCRECIMVGNVAVFQALLVLAYLNSALNPILYSFLNREFRESFIKIFKLRWHQSNNNLTP